MPINFTAAVRRVQEALGDVVLPGKGTKVYFLTCDFCDKQSIQVTIEPKEIPGEAEKLEEPERMLN